MHVLLQHFTQLLGYIWVWLHRHVIAVYGSVSWHRHQSLQTAARTDDHTTPAQAGHLGQSGAAGFAPDTADKQSVTADNKNVDPTSSYEAEFASAHAQHGYGYGQGSSSTVLSERQSQFPQLSGITYLDHAAATLCSKQQLEEAHAEQLQQLMGNPHSQLPVGIDHSAVAIEELRLMTLNMLNAPADQYEVVFTSGATAALRLVGEAFPWTAGSSHCAYLTVNHNSALGVRQQAAAAGAVVTAVQPQQLQQLPEQQQSQRLQPRAQLPRQQQQQQQQVLSELQAQHQQHDGLHQPSQRHHLHQAKQGMQVEQQGQAQHQTVYSLFIALAECNMSGTQYDCVSMFHHWQHQQQQEAVHQQSDLLDQAQQQQQQQMQQVQHPPQQQSQRHIDDQQQQQQQQHWLLLVDAAKACATHPLDLAACGIDMLVLSYYKMFGHPTGLGALVVRRSLLPLLQQHKAYFGGGTVEVALPDTSYVVRRSGPAGLEDGTLPFTAIAAARHGFSQLRRLGGLPAVSRHTACLTWHLMLQLKQLRHSNGQPALVLYCSPAVHQLLEAHISSSSRQHGSSAVSSTNSSSGCRENSAAETYSRSSSSSNSSSVPEPSVLARFRELQGPVVCFNLMRLDGSWVGHKEVGKLAAIHSICLRTGCFCNPGACAHFLGLSSQDLLSQHAAGHVCGDDHDLIDGRPNGAVRASFGWMSNHADVAVLLDFVQKFFVNNSGSSGIAVSTGGTVSSTGGKVGTSGTVSSTGGTGGTALASAAAVAADKGSESSSDAQARIRAVTAAGKAAVSGDDWAAAADTPVQQAPKSAASAATAGVPAPSVSTSTSLTSCSSAESSTASAPAPAPAVAGSTAGRLTALYLYPVKSCAPQQVTAWPIGPNGLLYDREWAVCGPDGQVLSQKRAPRLTQVRAEVDLQGQVLRLSAAGVGQQLLVPLQSEGHVGVPHAAASDGGGGGDGGSPSSGAMVGRGGDVSVPQQEVRVCGDTVCAQVPVGSVVGVATQSEPSVQTLATDHSSSSSSSSNSSSGSSSGGGGTSSREGSASDAGAAAGSEAAVQHWFTAAVGVPCKLVRQVHSSREVKLQQQQQQQQQQQSGVTQGLANGHHTAAEQSLVQTLGFANESQYLLVNQASVDYVANQLTTSATAAANAQVAAAVDALQFRPNLVVSGFGPWAEDAWLGVTFTPAGSKASLASAAAGGAAASEVLAADVAAVAESLRQQQQQQTEKATMDNQQQQQQQALLTARASTHLQVVGPCGRCDMVSIDQGTGLRRGNQLLSFLARERRVGGKLQFGVLLANGGDVQGQVASTEAAWLHVGDAVTPVQVPR